MVEYKDAKGESRPAYNLTRDGFTILVMGFTGKAAMKWKIRYIEAFNAMEQKLLEPQQLPADTPASFDQHKELFPLLTEWSILLRDKEIWEPQEVFHQALMTMQFALGNNRETPLKALTAVEVEYAKEYLNTQVSILKGIKSPEELEAAERRSEAGRKAARARWDKKR